MQSISISLHAFTLDIHTSMYPHMAARKPHTPACLPTVSTCISAWARLLRWQRIHTHNSLNSNMLYLHTRTDPNTHAHILYNTYTYTCILASMRPDTQYIRYVCNTYFAVNLFIGQTTYAALHAHADAAWRNSLPAWATEEKRYGELP